MLKPPDAASVAAPIAAIFRLQMFKPSEPFIAAQAGALTQFAPMYLGRAAFGPPPCEALCRPAHKQGTRPSAAILWNAASRDPGIFRAALGDIRPSLIHAHFGPDAVYALPLARRLGVPLITTFHGFDVTVTARRLLTSGSPYLTNYALFARQLARQGARFLCVSAHILRQALARGFPAARTHLHYIGIDTEALASAPAATAPNILHVARLVEKKGGADLLRAFAHLHPAHPTATLTMIGDGPLRGALQSLAETLGVTSHVRFLGALPNAEVFAQLRRAAIFALPSVTAASGDTEGLPITILEASALGLPVVATQHGGIPEAVIDGETGLLVPERDPAALAAALDRLLSDDTLRVTLGAAARRRMEAHFNLRRQTALLEAHYAELLA